MSDGPTLETFLVEAKAHLKKAIEKKEKVTLVIGDEHADLDSVVSSILFAYLRTASPPAGAWSKVYTPLLNASRNEIGAKDLLSRLLPELSLKQTHLIGVEDLVNNGHGTKSGLTAENTRFFLLDHNKMLGRKDQDYSTNVLGCIDHHEDENYVPLNTAPEPRIIGQSGCCTSLVVNWFAPEWSYLEGGGASQTQLAKLALAPILIDTQNLSSHNANRQDTQAVEFLEGKIMGDGAYDRTAFYDMLVGSGSGSTASTTEYTSIPTATETTTTTTTAEPITTTDASKFETVGNYDPHATFTTTGPTGFIKVFTGDDYATTGTATTQSTTSYGAGSASLTSDTGSSTTAYDAGSTSLTSGTGSSNAAYDAGSTSLTSGTGSSTAAYDAGSSSLTSGTESSAPAYDAGNAAMNTGAETSAGSYSAEQTTTSTDDTPSTTTEATHASGGITGVVSSAFSYLTGHHANTEEHENVEPLSGASGKDVTGTSSTDYTSGHPETSDTTTAETHASGATGFLTSRLPWFAGLTSEAPEVSRETTYDGAAAGTAAETEVTIAGHGI